ncbi:MAG: hypothetical protein IPN69_11115 [Acidobacteria bacterium]|nr:hypothetical protein [Acidobacteriota bacterium]
MNCLRKYLIPLCLLIGLLIAGPVLAQTKKKPTRKPTPVKPVAQPTVITQDEVYKNQSQQIIEGTTNPSVQPTETPTTPETTDEKLDKISKRLSELGQRMKTMESNRQNDYDEKQKRLLMNLDILTRAEQRSETLRKQLFDMIEKQNSVKTRLEQLEFDMRPEMIDRQVAFAGTLRPEELRDMRRKNIEVERSNLQALLTEIQSTRSNLEANVQKADQLVERLRAKLEKEIDDALSDTPKEP